jgi:hypothetical protein
MQEVAGTAIATIAERVKGGYLQGPHFTCIETKRNIEENQKNRNNNQRRCDSKKWKSLCDTTAQ